MKYVRSHKRRLASGKFAYVRSHYRADGNKKKAKRDFDFPEIIRVNEKFEIKNNVFKFSKNKTKFDFEFDDVKYFDNEIEETIWLIGKEKLLKIEHNKHFNDYVVTENGKSIEISKDIYLMIKNVFLK